MFNRSNKTQQISIMAILAAVYIVISIIPGIPVAPGVEIQFEAGFASVMGILLGPYLGFLTALLASVASWALLGSGIFGLPFLLNPAVNAFIVGIIIYKRDKIAIGVSLLFYTVLLILQVVSPPLITAVPAGFPVDNFTLAIFVLYDKLIGLALIIPTVLLFTKYKDEDGSIPLITSTIIILFSIILIGNILDNLLGTMLFSYPVVYSIYGFTLDGVQYAFIATPFIYLPIRIAQSIFATIITVGVVKALWKNKLETLIK
ncbi:MAG: ECF transporter S component [Candidatus Odinarchaeia archaeon]